MILIVNEGVWVIMEKAYFRFFRYRDKEYMIFYWVNNDGNVFKGCWDNIFAVVFGVFRLDDVDFIIF